MKSISTLDLVEEVRANPVLTFASSIPSLLFRYKSYRRDYLIESSLGVYVDVESSLFKKLYRLSGSDMMLPRYYVTS